jgi:hypothetical protein
MPLKMETTVSPKRRDNSTTPGGDILEDVVESIYQWRDPQNKYLEWFPNCFNLFITTLLITTVQIRPLLILLVSKVAIVRDFGQVDLGVD